jgi:hypothetical protein
VRVVSKNIGPREKKAQLYRTIRQNGKVVQKQRVGTSHYQWNQALGRPIKECGTGNYHSRRVLDAKQPRCNLQRVFHWLDNLTNWIQQWQASLELAIATSASVVEAQAISGGLGSIPTCARRR